MITNRGLSVAKLVLLLIFLIIALLSFSCTTTGAIAREARCGIGKDYICTTHFLDNKMHTICACRTRHTE